MDETAEHLTERLAVDLDDGFTELVRLYARTVHAFLFRVTGSAVEAEDLGQDTFLRAYTALKDYSPARRRDLRCRAWLMTIAANVWRNQIRTNVRHPVSPAPVENSAESWADESPGPEERASTADDRGRLVSALTELPEKSRVAVVLRHVVGMSYGEIAESQGCPVGTVKAQVSRGVGNLRELLEAGDPPPREVLQ
ncbi:RNA polymerase sigma factor [Streptomyces sp. H39-S7]|uniref:RNA polymerase sigma factor n=1 Tax=Streptomyces sp. H39-S7 TaxID=3004357 RepID=UPI0022B0491C|nr:sigma-70 family RNA polymerase sigma factor [Streptomyces sp. H39-S7]MCZ4124635.1 sigma-70 family RNA polymerase sigma factor [Streptomyces sp. H39-S7]